MKIFRRCSKILRDFEMSSKTKDLFEDLCKIFQRYSKDIYSFTEMNKLKTFKNLFKIFMKIFGTLGFLDIKGFQRSSERLFNNFEEIKTIFLSHMEVLSGDFEQVCDKMHS